MEPSTTDIPIPLPDLLAWAEILRDILKEVPPASDAATRVEYLIDEIEGAL
jgi:hypothetical protein